MTEALAIPSCRVTPTGLVIEGELTEERWEAIGDAITAVHKRFMWVVGDWLRAGETAGYLPRGKLKDAAKRFGIEYQTAAQAVRVSKAFESCNRIQDLTWRHHQIAANSEHAEDLLGWAKDNDKSVRELQEEKKRRDGDDGPETCEVSDVIDKIRTVIFDAWEDAHEDVRSIIPKILRSIAKELEAERKASNVD
jgi:hypothetical protein